MMETLCCTIKRVAPAMLTPPVKACLLDDRTANKIKATTIDNNVKIVRTFFRFRLLQISTKNFIKSLHRLIAELSLVQINRSRRASGRMGIMGHHDDSFAVLPIKRLEQIQDLVTRFAIQVTGWLITQQESWVGDNAAGNADALLLAARECARIMLCPLGKANHRQSRGDMLLPFGPAEAREQQGQFDIPLGRKHRPQVVKLKHESDMPRPPGRQ